MEIKPNDIIELFSYSELFRVQNISSQYVWAEYLYGPNQGEIIQEERALITKHWSKQ